MASFFRSKTKGSHQLNLSGNTSYYIADVNELNGLVIGTDLVASALVFDPRTGKIWALTTGTITSAAGVITVGATDETPAGVPDGTVTSSILRWNGSAWVEESDITVDASGNVSTSGTITTTGSGTITSATTVNAGTGITSTTGNIAASSGNVSASGTVTGGTGVTATTGDVTASAGAVSANTTVTAGTGVTATTGGLTATAGGLTVTAGTTDINDVTNISGAVTLDNAAANSLTMTGTTNTVSLNGSGATSLTLGGTTSTITLSGSGTKKVTGLDTPVAATDAVNKAYADSLSAGLDPKESTLTATTAVLSGTFIANNGTPATGEKTYNTTSKTITWFATEGPTAIDGVTLANGNTILVKDETATSGPSAGEGRQYNGIYTRTSLDVWTRRSDMDGSPANEISTGNFTFITSGSVNVGKGFVLSATNASNPDEINADTETKVFTQFSSAGGGVTSVSTESGSATPSSGSLTITGSPSINTSGSGSTVTVALAADLATGASGFTIADEKIPVATAANTLGVANLSFNNATDVLTVGTQATLAGASGATLSATTGDMTVESVAGNLYVSGITSAAIGIDGIDANLAFSSAGAGQLRVPAGQNSVLRSDANRTVLYNSTTTDVQTTGSAITAGASPVVDTNFIREKVVQRKTGTTSVVLTTGAPAAKFLVSVIGNTAAERYASEVMATSTNATTGVDSVEYSIVSGTTPAALSIAATASGGNVVLTVTQTAGTIVVEAIPLV